MRSVSLYVLMLVLISLFAIETTRAQQGTQQQGTQQQRGARLGGTVVDEAGAAITVAKLTLTNKLSGTVRETTADDAGRFSFADVSPGEYSLRSEARGFNLQEQELKIGAESLANLHVSMKVSVNEAVTVTGTRTQPVAAEANADAADFEGDLIRGLPLPTESQQLLSFVAGFLSQAAQGTDEVSIVVDGVEANQLTLPTFAVRRLSVNKNPYAAEYRRPGKARIEVLTQDGSRRRHHGGVGYSLRNSVFDARNPFAQVKPDLDRRLLETSFGGPVPKANRQADFFFSGERLVNNGAVLINAITPAGPLVENVPNSSENTYFLGRFDYRPNRMHTLTARYDHNRDSAENSGIGNFRLSEQAINSRQRTHRLQFSERAFFSANLLNNFRFVFEQDERSAGAPTGQPAIRVIGAFTSGPSQTFSAGRGKTLEFQDVGTYYRASHTLRFGVRFRPRFIDSTDATNFGGTFDFPSLERFAAAAPLLFRINQGDPNISFTQHEADAFFQDEVKLRQNLTLTLGARYDWQSAINGDRNNFAPRLAFAFAPGSGQKTVLRGGAGIFYERLPPSAIQRSLLFNGERIRELVIRDPSFPDPFVGGVLSLPPPSVWRVATDIATPYLLLTSFGVERQLWNRTQATVEYAHIRGSHLFRSRNINAPLPETARRPDPTLLNINQIESSASMRSNALTFSFRGYISRWFRGTAQYTTARTTNDTSGAEPGAGFPFTLPADNYNLQLEYGRADFDERHRFSLAGLLELPYDFRLGTVLSLASQSPYDITTGFDDNGDTFVNDRPFGITRNTGRGAGSAQVNLRLTKLFSVPRPFNNDRRSKNLQLNIDAFNALNHVNLSNFIGEQSSPFFGQAVTARQPRTVQLSMKYSF